MLGDAYERSGAVDLAEEQYSKALELQHYAPAPGLRMAEFLMRYGKVDQAERVLEQVRANTPTDRQVLSLLAQLKLNRQDWIGAQEIADALKTLDNSGEDQTANQILAAALGGQNKLEESIRVLETSLPDASNRQAVLSDLVRAYARAGKIDVAEELLKKTIEGDPANVQTRILLASIYRSKGKSDLAEAALKDAVEADVKGTTGYAALSQFYLSADRLDEAEATAQTGLKRDGNSAALRLLLALTYEKAGRYDDAITEYEGMVKSDPESTIVANNLASLLSERRGDPESLDRAYDIALRFRNSEIPQFLDTLGWIYYLRGNYPQALSLLKTAAEKLPGVGMVQFHLGMALKQLDQKDLAVASLEKAISLVPASSATDLERVHAALDELLSPAAPADATAPD